MYCTQITLTLLFRKWQIILLRLEGRKYLRGTASQDFSVIPICMGENSVASGTIDKGIRVSERSGAWL